ncbi:unnamed protein product [Linum tenue]|uniref:Uncharacterized protein n=1 Tax=Linum tenue TaxID=586396 RepID=A0AAV0PVR2_9ROSI|nr:unnamed protein product [Linum tenue]
MAATATTMVLMAVKDFIVDLRDCFPEHLWVRWFFMEASKPSSILQLRAYNLGYRRAQNRTWEVGIKLQDLGYLSSRNILLMEMIKGADFDLGFLWGG